RLADQSWSHDQALRWSYATQGSRLVPALWFRSLEVPGSSGSFSDPEYLDAFGYIKPPPSFAQDLPIGFAIDRQSDRSLRNTKLRWYSGQNSTEPWIGFTCAA